MRFNTHSRLDGQHAFLSASKHHWLGYDEDKLFRVYRQQQAARRGDELHDFAHQAIRLRQKLPDVPKTLNMYVNDAIGFQMTPEQMLYWSDNAFGTADAIAFRNNVLRIHDLKTGLNQTSFRQLMVYAAYFCLEYRFNPFELERIALRIYQSDEVKEMEEVDPDEIMHIMEKIKSFDKLILAMRMEELS